MEVSEPSVSAALPSPTSNVQQSRNNQFGSFSISGGINFFGSEFVNYGSQQPSGSQLSSIGADYARAAELVKSLAFPEQWNRFDQISDAFSSTFEWIFEAESIASAPPSQPQQGPGSSRPATGFVKWLQSAGTLYWISGKPAAGKSTLMKFIIQHSDLQGHLRKWAGPRQLLTPCYFFWRPGTTIQKDFSGLLRSLLGQILEASPRLASYISNSSEMNGRWTFQVASKALSKVLLASDTSFCFFIDGLDEFQGSEEDQDNMVTLLQDIAQLPNVKVCLSSRPEAFFVDTFGGLAFQLKLQDLTYEDIRKTASGRLMRQPRYRSQTSSANGTQLHREIIERLCQKAEGVFLWLHLTLEDVIRGIKRHECLEESLQRIESLRSNLGDLFIDLLDRVDDLHRIETARIVRFMLFMRQDTNMWIFNRFGDLHRNMVTLTLTAAHGRPDAFASILQDNKRNPDSGACVDQCFGRMRVFQDNVKEYSMGLLETVQRGKTNCTSQELRHCMCCVGLGARERTCQVYKLLNHFDSIEVVFVHRSAYDFFMHNEQGVEFLDKFATDKPLTFRDCYDALSIIVRLSMRALPGPASRWTSESGIKYALPDGPSLQVRLDAILTRHWEVNYPLRKFEICCLLLISLGPPSEWANVSQITTVSGAHHALRDILIQDRDCFITTLATLDALLSGLSIARSHLKADNIVAREAHCTLYLNDVLPYNGDKNVIYEKGPIKADAKRLSAILTYVDNHINRARSCVVLWRRFLDASWDDQHARARSSLCWLTVTNSASIYIESGLVGSLHVAEAILHGVRLRDCLPKGKACLVMGDHGGPIKLDHWSLMILHHLIVLAQRSDQHIRVSLIQSIRDFFISDVDADKALCFADIFFVDKGAALYLSVESSLAALAGQLQIIHAGEYHSLFRGVELRPSSSMHKHVALLVPQDVDIERIELLASVKRLKCFSRTDTQVYLGNAVQSFVYGWVGVDGTSEPKAAEALRNLLLSHNHVLELDEGQ